MRLSSSATKSARVKMSAGLFHTWVEPAGRTGRTGMQFAFCISACGSMYEWDKPGPLFRTTWGRVPDWRSPKIVYGVWKVSEVTPKTGPNSRPW